MEEGRFILHRFNGDEIFHTKDATIQAHANPNGITIWLEVNTDLPAIQTAPDTAEMEGNPNAEVSITLSALHLTEFVGQHFSMPTAYDEKTEERLAILYYFEHEDIDENEITILARRADEFLIRWTGTTVDVNYYDGSKPRTRVEIEGWFKFKDIEQWLSV